MAKATAPGGGPMTGCRSDASRCRFPDRRQTWKGQGWKCGLGNGGGEGPGFQQQCRSNVADGLPWSLARNYFPPGPHSSDIRPSIREQRNNRSWLSSARRGIAGRTETSLSILKSLISNANKSLPICGDRIPVASETDLRRTRWPDDQGFRISGFWNNEVLNTAGVLNARMVASANPLPARRFAAATFSREGEADE